MTPAKLRSLDADTLDAYYAPLTVQATPAGRYDGRAWIIGSPWIGHLIRTVWYGKVFEHGLVTNRIAGLLMVQGDVYREGPSVILKYDHPWITDTVRQVSPTSYLGRMQMGRVRLHFTLEHHG